MKPEELLFAKTHEWAAVSTDPQGAKIATVGISAFAVEALTDLVFMQLPAVGRKVKAGESFGEIESVKAVSDLYSPVDGEVIEVNTALPNKLETLNSDPLREITYLFIFFQFISLTPHKLPPPAAPLPNNPPADKGASWAAAATTISFPRWSMPSPRAASSTRRTRPISPRPARATCRCSSSIKR